jgi:hypothetical protein
MKPHGRQKSRCAIRIVGSALLLTSLSEFAFSQVSKPFSPACEKVHRDATRQYWLTTVPREQADRMTDIASSDDAVTVGAGLVDEVLAGRITIQQLGAGSLAALDAVQLSAVCVERDRLAAKQLRLILPELLMRLTQQYSKQRASTNETK